MKKYNNCYHIGPFEQFSRKVYTTEEGLPSNQATALCFDKKGNLFLGTDKGLSKFENGKFIDVDTGSDDAVNVIYCAQNGHVFAGAGSRLVEFNGKRRLKAKEFSSKIVDMKIDGDETWWILTETHLYRKCKNSEDFDLKIGVPGDGTKLAVLRDNKVYVGTAGSGLHALTGKRWHWSELMEDMTGLLSNYVTCVDFDKAGYVWVGTDKGVCVYDDKSYWLDSKNTYGLPDANITAMATDNEGNRYFATTTGLIYQHNGILSYYGYKRWIPDPCATDVAVSDDGRTICVATKNGLSIISKQVMTLEEKAAYFREMAEKYNIRKDGYCLGRDLDHKGVVDENEGYVGVSDNDGLWTGIYLAGLCYEYAVTKNKETLELARRSLGAMIKLTTITGKDGFTARALRYKDERNFGEYLTSDEWHLVQNGEIEWLGETSSDEMTGHFFAYAIYYDLCADEKEKAEIAVVVKKIMDHIIENNFHLVDVDGKPTTWANWDPKDLNDNHKWIYEKGTNSLEILSFLKVAKHMTGDEKYDEVFDSLVRDHHYGMNIMQYRIPDGHLLHIDDQLGFLSIMTLLSHTDDPAVRSIATMGLTHHFSDERIEHNAIFDIIYGAVTGEKCDVDVIAEELVDFPLDLLSWEVYNSHRTDLEWDHRPEELGMVPQLYVPLQPHERRLCNCDGNRFVCDCGCEDLFKQASGDDSARMIMYPSVSCSKGMNLEVGNMFLLPYWMGRYYGIIE